MLYTKNDRAYITTASRYSLIKARLFQLDLSVFLHEPTWEAKYTYKEVIGVITMDSVPPAYIASGDGL